MVKVYYFKFYDIHTDAYVKSKRMATEGAVAKLGSGFSIIKETMRDIDESRLDPEREGMTLPAFGFLEFIENTKL